MNKKLPILVVVILLLGVMGMYLLQGAANGFVPIAILVLFVGLFVWVIPSVLKRVKGRVWVLTGVIIMLGLLFPTSLLMSATDSGPLSSLPAATLFFLPSLAFINAAFLLFTGLNDSSVMANDGSKLLPLALSALLVVKTLHNLYDLTLWDNTYDPLGYLWLIVPIFAVLVSGLALSIALTEWTKLAGPVYSILVSILLIGVSASAQNVDFHRETASRAERTVRAIESYYAQNGSYPKTLSSLTPRYLLSLPKPMIMHGQEWCYQSGQGYYRLGYIDREHWSNPNLIGRVYKSVGNVPDVQSICLNEFNSAQSDQPDYPFIYVMDDK